MGMKEAAERYIEVTDVGHLNDSQETAGVSRPWLGCDFGASFLFPLHSAHSGWDRPGRRRALSVHRCTPESCAAEGHVPVGFATLDPCEESKDCVTGWAQMSAVSSCLSFSAGEPLNWWVSNWLVGWLFLELHCEDLKGRVHFVFSGDIGVLVSWWDLHPGEGLFIWMWSHDFYSLSLINDITAAIHLSPF